MNNDNNLDFDELDALLSATGASWEAAEAHGAFCGRACLSGAAAIRAWVNDLLDNPDAEDVLARERAGKLETLAASTMLILEAGEMGFQPMLPDDDEPLTARISSLADWCHGFMHGLVAAGGADEGPRAEALESDVVSEILEDFDQITRAGAAEDAGEESEQAYVELIEYVRVSAQLVYDETAALRNAGASAGGNA